MLTVYVFSPEHPMLTRGDVGLVNPLAKESDVNKLQIWIFESASGKLVGYLNTTDTETLNGTEASAAFQITVDDNFVRNKPDVDVYVLANVSMNTCGCAFNAYTTRDELKSQAKIDADHFGLSPLTDEVPEEGLPMAGVLRNQPVIGNAPVLRIGNQNNIATVSQQRAVSKLRFVFANSEGSAEMKITNIQLDANVLPTEEYLFPQTTALTYDSRVVSLLSAPKTVVEKDDPMEYVYNGQEAQVYETLIEQSGLTVVGPYYLRESDKRLSGTITYTIGDTQKTGTFQMEKAGDFLRNHTWIVYGYHSGGGYLQMNTIYIKDWNNRTESHEVYNW
jgi:hypothetical protein